MPATVITSPDSPALDALCRELASAHRRARSFRRLARRTIAIVRRLWRLPMVHAQGLGWAGMERAGLHSRLPPPERSLPVDDVHPDAAHGRCQRIADGDTTRKCELLPALVSGESFATVGISHLTTSRRHLGRPALAARETADGFELDGFSPWVTGGAQPARLSPGRRWPTSGRSWPWCRPTCRASRPNGRRSWSDSLRATPARCNSATC